MGKDNIPIVNLDLCIGCGVCATGEFGSDQDKRLNLNLKFLKNSLKQGLNNPFGYQNGAFKNFSKRRYCQIAVKVNCQRSWGRP